VEKLSYFSPCGDCSEFLFRKEEVKGSGKGKEEKEVGWKTKEEKGKKRKRGAIFSFRLFQEDVRKKVKKNRKEEGGDPHGAEGGTRKVPPYEPPCILDRSRGGMMKEVGILRGKGEKGKEEERSPGKKG